jgi:cytochrome c-type biogenesis protein CcmE
MDQPLATPVEPANRARRLKFVLGSVVVMLTLAALVAWAMGRPGSTSFYMSVSELQAAGAGARSDLRVNGNVVPGSLSRSGIETSFAISDGGGRLTVVTEEPLPDVFHTAYRNDPSAVEVVAQGRYDGRRLVAHQVLAKCPSKFKARA